MANRICFIELPAGTTGRAISFYAEAFGFAMTDFGPASSCTMTGNLDLGLQADAKEASLAPLPVFQVESSEATDSKSQRDCLGSRLQFWKHSELSFFPI
jgi:predicted enzyme related to lactoylglutathione lyase